MERPNILVLMPDQLRADSMSCAGHPHVTTPGIDRLAADGVRFTNFHTTCPICMPARSSFLSGLYCHNHGQWFNCGQLPEGGVTYMTRLRAAGYRTCQIGKSHLYSHLGSGHLNVMAPYLRTLGFEDVVESTGPWATVIRDSVMTDEWRAKGILDLFREDYRRRERLRMEEGREALWPSPMPEGEGLDDFVGRAAVEYLERYGRREPFCVFVGFGGPDEPWDPPASWAKRYEGVEPMRPLPRAPTFDWMTEAARAYAERIGGRDFPEDEWRRIRQLYYAKVSHIDSWIERILDMLERRGMMENTLVLFWSDHGERLCDRGGLHKMVFYDESVRVPLIIRRPDGAGAGTVADGLCETTDAMPTLLAAAGLDTRDCLGSSLLPATEGEGTAIHDAVFSEIDYGGRHTMVRTKATKMVLDAAGRTLQLFDMERDPQERVNLAGKPDMAEDALLRERILRWRLATDVPQHTAGRG